MEKLLKSLMFLMILGLLSCGRGKKESPQSGETRSENAAPQENQAQETPPVATSEDKVLPVIDDRSYAPHRKITIMRYAALAGNSLGLIISAWPTYKIEALRKFLLSTDVNEANRINDKLLKLANTKLAYEEVTRKLPLDIEDALKGNLSAAETDRIKSDLTALLEKRSKVEAHISQLKIQIDNHATSEAARTNTSPASVVKSRSASLAEYFEKLSTNNAQLQSLQRDLSWSHYGLYQVDSEIAKIVKANNRVMRVFDTWKKARLLFVESVRSLDVNFHRVFRSLLTKMIRLHANRIKMRMGKETIIRKNFNLAKIGYLTAGGFVIIGSNYMLWTTIEEGHQAGEELLLNITRIVNDEDELPSKEEVSELSDAQ